MLRNLMATTALVTVIATGSAFAASEPKAAGDIFVTPTAEADYASDLIGATVYDRGGEGAEAIGEINDLMVADDGSIDAVIIGVGGFLGVGEKDVAVSYDSLDIATDGDGDRWVIFAASREDLEAAPDFERDMAMAPDATDRNADPAMQDRAADQAMTDDPATAPTADQQAMTEVAPGEQPATDVMPGPDRNTLRLAEAGTISVDNLMGVTVYSADNANVGEVSDVIIAKDGSEGAIEAVVIDVGGFLGIGEKPVAVALDTLEIMTDENGSLYAYSKFTEDQLDAAPEYDRDGYEANRDEMLVRSRG